MTKQRIPIDHDELYTVALRLFSDATRELPPGGDYEPFARECYRKAATFIAVSKQVTSGNVADNLTKE